MPVTAAFYPLQFAAEQVGGEHVRVTSLTKPGVEPHDLELTPRAVGWLRTPKPSSTWRASSRPSTRPCARQARGCRRVDVTPGRRRHDRGPRRPALLARPDPARRRRDRPGRGPRPARPGQRRRLRANAAPSSPTSTRLDAEFRTGLAALPHPRARHRPRRLRLPRRALRPAPGGGRRREPRHRARRRDRCATSAPTCARPGCPRSTPRAWSPPRSPRRSPARPGPGWPCSTRSRASPTCPRGRDYLEVMRANLATLRAGQECR